MTFNCSTQFNSIDRSHTQTPIEVFHSFPPSLPHSPTHSLIPLTHSFIHSLTHRADGFHRFPAARDTQNAPPGLHAKIMRLPILRDAPHGRALWSDKENKATRVRACSCWFISIERTEPTMVSLMPNFFL